MVDWSEKVLTMHSLLIKKVAPKMGQFDGDDDLAFGGDLGMMGAMSRFNRQMF
jgi:hypothetical protein